MLRSRGMAMAVGARGMRRGLKQFNPAAFYSTSSWLSIDEGKKGEVARDLQGDEEDEGLIQRGEDGEDKNFVPVSPSGRLLFENKEALDQWDGTVERTFLDFANEWEEKFEQYDELEGRKRQEVAGRGEKWTEEHEMDDDIFKVGFMVNDMEELKNLKYLRDMNQTVYGGGYQDESVFGSGITENKDKDFKRRKELSPTLAMTKGQLGAKVEHDLSAVFPLETPTEFIDRSDDVQNYDHFRTVHRGLANQQIKQVVVKARQRKLDLEKGLSGYVINTKRVHKVITTGMEESTIVLFLIGNGQGAAGFGFGKGPDYESAVERAKINAERDMIAIDRFEDRTIYHPLYGKHNNTQCIIRPAKRGTGTRSGELLHFVLESFGVDDVVGKMIGNNNPYSQIQAIFSAFSKHSSYEESAWGRGRRVRDLGFYGFKHYEDRDYGGMMRMKDKI